MYLKFFENLIRYEYYSKQIEYIAGSVGADTILCVCSYLLSYFLVVVLHQSL